MFTHGSLKLFTHGCTGITELFTIKKKLPANIKNKSIHSLTHICLDKLKGLGHETTMSKILLHKN